MRNKEVVSTFSKFQYYGVEHPFIVFLSEYLSNHGYTQKKKKMLYSRKMNIRYVIMAKS